MVLNHGITARIKKVLEENPQGMSITDIVSAIGTNRNTAGRHLDKLLASGQVEMRRLGMAKIYTLSQRVPISAVLSISSDLIMQIDKNLRIVFANEPFLSFLSIPSADLFGKNLEYSRVVSVFDEVAEEFVHRIKEGLAGTEWGGEIALTEPNIIFFCRIAPTVFETGQKGVSVILENITQQKRADAALMQSESRFRRIFEDGPLGMGLADREYRLMNVNRKLCEILGYSKKELLGRSLREITHPDDTTRETTQIKKLYAGVSKTYRAEKRYFKKDGSVIWCSITVSPLEDEHHEVVATISLIEDISIWKLAEKDLRESEDRYRTLIEISPDAIIVHQDGTILYANPAALVLLNASHTREIIGRKLFDFIHPASRDTIAANIEKDIIGEKTPPTETYMLRTDGTTVTVEGRGVGIVFNGKPAVQVAIRDITERKRIEEVLKESEEKYRNVFDFANEAIMLHPLSTAAEPGRFIEVNEAACRMLGYTREELFAMGPADILPQELRPLTHTIIQQAETQEIFLIETRLQRKDGTTFPVESSARLITFRGRRVWLSLIRDISERKRAEDALHESEGRYRALFDRSLDCAYLNDFSGNFIDANQSTLKLLGYTRDEVKSLNFASLLTPDQTSTALKITQEVLATGTQQKPTEFRMRCKNGGFVDVITTAALIYKDGAPYAIEGIAHNITDRKRAEDALKESEEKYRTLVERANDGICIIQDNIIKFCNPAIVAFWGGSADEILGRNFNDFLHPDALLAVTKLHIMRIAGETVPSKYETILQRKDGSRFFAEVNAGICPFEGKPANHVVVRDINDRKKAEEALKKSEERFRDLINTTADIVWQTDAERRFVFVSPQVEKILGYTPDELVGRTPFEFLDPDTIESSRYVFDTAAMTHQSIVLHESRWLDRDGNLVVLESHATPSYNSDGTCSGFRGIDRDITDR
jgi:PAS domain S-box-containing protein